MSFCQIKTRLKFEIVGDNRFKLLEDFTFDNGERVFLIPANFITDGFTIPSLFSPLQSHTGKGVEIAVVHDYCYSIHRPDDITREEADLIFYNGLICLGINPIKAKLMYLAVRLFGKNKWRKK